MIINSIISGVCLLVSIILFLKFNSGLGGSLGSIKKRLIYLLSIIAFIAFIVFLNRAYYYSDNQNYKQIAIELKKEYSDLTKIISTNSNNLQVLIHNKQLKMRELILQLDSDTIKETRTFQLIKELKNEYYELDDLINTSKDYLNINIIENTSKIQKLSQQIVSDVHKENDTFVIIITNILSAFIAFVIAFTFKNKILL